jgi:hypothetical protein
MGFYFVEPLAEAPAHLNPKYSDSDALALLAMSGNLLDS